jgi:hypothetical protein
VRSVNWAHGLQTACLGLLGLFPLIVISPLGDLFPTFRVYALTALPRTLGGICMAVWRRGSRVFLVTLVSSLYDNTNPS